MKKKIIIIIASVVALLIIIVSCIMIAINSNKTPMTDIYLASWYDISKENLVCSVPTVDVTYSMPEQTIAYTKDYEYSYLLDNYETEEMTINIEGTNTNCNYFFLDYNYYCFNEYVIKFENHVNKTNIIRLVASEVLYNENNIDYNFYIPINMCCYFNFKSTSTLTTKSVKERLSEYFSNNEFNDLVSYYEKIAYALSSDNYYYCVIDKSNEIVYFNCKTIKTLKNIYIVEVAVDYKNKELKIKTPSADDFVVLYSDSEANS